MKEISWSEQCVRENFLYKGTEKAYENYMLGVNKNRNEFLSALKPLYLPLFIGSVVGSDYLFHGNNSFLANMIFLSSCTLGVAMVDVNLGQYRAHIWRPAQIRKAKETIIEEASWVKKVLF